MLRVSVRSKVLAKTSNFAQGTIPKFYNPAELQLRNSTPLINPRKTDRWPLFDHRQTPPCDVSNFVFSWVRLNANKHFSSNFHQSLIIDKNLSDFIYAELKITKSRDSLSGERVRARAFPKWKNFIPKKKTQIYLTATPFSLSHSRKRAFRKRSRRAG